MLSQEKQERFVQRVGAVAGKAGDEAPSLAGVLSPPPPWLPTLEPEGPLGHRTAPQEPGNLLLLRQNL